MVRLLAGRKGVFWLSQIEWTESFKRHYRKYTRHDDALRQQTQKAIRLMATNLSYPSLRAKPLKAAPGSWECSINAGWRLIFKRDGNVLRLLTMGPHDDLP